MNSIADLLKTKIPETNLCKSERAEIVKQFVEKLNSERQHPYKPLSPRFVAIRMSHLKTNQDLYMFLGQCKESKSFSKYWWWALKPKK